MCEEITIHRQLIWLGVQKILSTDSGVYYLWDIYLIQLIRLIHLIFKPETKNTNET